MSKIGGRPPGRTTAADPGLIITYIFPGALALCRRFKTSASVIIRLRRIVLISSDGEFPMDEWYPQEQIQMGSDRGRGNLLGVQPYLTPADYASESAFLERLRGYLEAARQAGWLNPRSVVVFPEYTGTWLVAAGGGPGVTQAATTSQAMRPLALRQPLAFLRRLLGSTERERVTAALFRLKARQVAEIYQRAFAGLAAQFGITIVAGSVLLPEPGVRDGVVIPGRGPLYNVSAVFGPDGRAHPRLARKAFPIAAELPFITAGNAGDLPIFETPAGRLGVLVCADAWYPQAYQAMRGGEAEFLAVPSFISSDDAWEQPWGGYNGAPAPADVDPADLGRLSEGQAWRKYALARRIGLSGAARGINVFLHGKLWDLGSNSGASLMVDGGEVREAQGRGAALLNLWL